MIDSTRRHRECEDEVTFVWNEVRDSSVVSKTTLHSFGQALLDVSVVLEALDFSVSAAKGREGWVSLIAQKHAISPSVIISPLITVAIFQYITLESTFFCLPVQKYC